VRQDVIAGFTIWTPATQLKSSATCKMMPPEKGVT